MARAIEITKKANITLDRAGK